MAENVTTTPHNPTVVRSRHDLVHFEGFPAATHGWISRQPVDIGDWRGAFDRLRDPIDNLLTRARILRHLHGASVEGVFPDDTAEEMRQQARWDVLGAAMQLVDLWYHLRDEASGRAAAEEAAEAKKAEDKP